MPGYDETQNLIGNDPFQRLMRAKYDRERIAAERDAAAMRYSLPSVGGAGEPGGAGISWFNPQNRGQIRNFEAERASDAAFVARYGMSPQDIMEAYRVKNIMAEGEPQGAAPAPGGPLADAAARVNSSPDNYVMAASRNPAPPAPAAPVGPGLNLRENVLGAREDSFAGFKRGLGAIPTPDTLAAGFDVGQRFNRSTTPDTINITPGQRAKVAALNRMTEAPLALNEAKAEATQASAKALEAKAQAASSTPSAKPTEAQKAVDRAYGKDYAAYITGGFARANTQISTLKNAQARLEAGKENLSGPVISALPERARMKSVAIQQEIEKTIQSTLKETLGAQFTAQEGENLMKRSFDPRLPEKENAKRVATIVGELEMMAKAKQEAARYYQKNGTMAGYSGKTYTLKNGQIVEADMPASAMPNNDPLGLGI
jgi:hypothetical protein